MKSLGIVLIAASILTACNKEERLCYLYAVNQDTIRLRITIADKAVNGSLIYNFYEKDRNIGTIRGTHSGDTIRAEYEFRSEGMTSTREVIFLKKKKSLIDLGSGGLELDEISCN